MKRPEAREKMMITAFQMGVNGDFDPDNEYHYFKDIDAGTQREYMERCYSLLCSKKDEIDSLISAHCRQWTIGRMPQVDLAILRVAVCEIAFMDDVPSGASINEAVELAKIYCDANSPSYINGILGSIAREKKKG
ncbi:MAG: transcription antitermination factor NusB [Firmicutes bacterium]|nr:transcription antitermination factor NusB [Bacillota bacterium]MBR3054006.1 transcription antitermination factor NusB [Bacillota bacterium]MCR4668120.1 transcription antitermination factor NusB [Clostridia bacterium]